MRDSLLDMDKQPTPWLSLTTGLSLLSFSNLEQHLNKSQLFTPKELDNLHRRAARSCRRYCFTFQGEASLQAISECQIRGMTSIWHTYI